MQTALRWGISPLFDVRRQVLTGGAGRESPLRPLSLLPIAAPAQRGKRDRTTRKKSVKKSLLLQERGSVLPTVRQGAGGRLLPGVCSPAEQRDELKAGHTAKAFQRRGRNRGARSPLRGTFAPIVLTEQPQKAPGSRWQCVPLPGAAPLHNSADGNTHKGTGRGGRADGCPPSPTRRAPEHRRHNSGTLPPSSASRTAIGSRTTQTSPTTVFTRTHRRPDPTHHRTFSPLPPVASPSRVRLPHPALRFPPSPFGCSPAGGAAGRGQRCGSAGLKVGGLAPRPAPPSCPPPTARAPLSTPSASPCYSPLAAQRRAGTVRAAIALWRLHRDKKNVSAEKLQALLYN